MEVGPSNMRLKLDWCQDSSIDAWIHWLLSDAPPNGELSNTGMQNCEIKDEELPPALKLFKVLLMGFAKPAMPPGTRS